MHYQLYIDSLFFLNFIFDLMLLYLMKKMLKCTATHLSLTGAAAFGAGMVCAVMILPYIGLLPKLVTMYLGISAGMIKIAFPAIGMKGLLKAQLLLYILSFLIGGFIQWIAGNIPFIQRNGLQMTEVIGIGYAAFVILQYLYRKWKEKGEDFVQVTLYRSDKTVTLTALVDTGNSLVEPISGKPVSVIERNYAGDIDKIKENAAYCMIPYHSIGRTHGMMEGVRIPKMVIATKEGTVTIDNAVLALSEGAISRTGNYQMILHPKLLEN